MSSRTLRRDLRLARARVAGAIVVLLVVLAASGLLIERSQDQQKQVLETRFDSRNATAARFIEAYVTEIFTHEQALSGRAFAGPVAGESFATTATDQGYDAAVLLDANGRLIASQPANPASVGRDLTGAYTHLREAVAGTPAVSGVVLSAVKAQPVVAFAVPFQTPQGRRVFSGAYAVEATPLAPFVRNATPFKTGHVVIVDGAGLVVAGNGPGDAGRRFTAVNPALASVDGPSGFVRDESAQSYVTQTPVAGTSWRLVFAVHTNELYAPLRGTGHRLPWDALVAVGISTLLSLAGVYRYLVQRARLRQSDARHRMILDSASDAFIGMDEGGFVSEWNAAAERLLGWTAAEALGRRLEELVVPPEQRAAHLAGVSRFLTTGVMALPAGPVQLVALRRDGSRVDIELTLSRMRWEAGWHFHAFLRDIGERLFFERQLHDLALTDGLTGLANRRAALDRLDQALSRAERHGNPVAVVFLDIDHFKAINDRNGHGIGDSVLVEVAARLVATFRTEDTIARLGGDEFLVVCEDLMLPADARVLMDRTHAALAEMFLVGAKSLNVTASLGLAISGPGSNVESLLELADAQMYEAKLTRVAFAAIVDPI
ncbi:MAG: diguanylate cyclase [Actinomycetota bacterium]